MIEIVPFRDEFAAAFEQLNREWLEAIGLLEDSDVSYLRDPRGNIIDKGGTILCAVSGGAVVGTVALLPLGDGVYELAKLAVAPEARGHGLGRALVGAAMDRAKSFGAHRLVLSSHSRLKPALRLYESLGFVPAPPAPGAVVYVDADVYLALDLSDAHPRPPTWTPA